MYFASYIDDISVFSIVINLHHIQKIVLFHLSSWQIVSPSVFLMKLLNLTTFIVELQVMTECFSTDITENIPDDILTTRASTALNNRVAFRTQRNPEIYAYILQIKCRDRTLNYTTSIFLPIYQSYYNINSLTSADTAS
jgi:hypothetical protein